MNLIQQWSDMAAHDRGLVRGAADALKDALDADYVARENLRHWKAEYATEEASYLAAAWANAQGKNAETRKAEVEAGLLAAQTGDSGLATAWEQMDFYMAEAARTASHLEQMKVAFQVEKVNAALTASVLAAMASMEPVLA